MKNQAANSNIENILSHAFRAESTAEKIKRAFSESGRRWITQADIMQITTSVFDSDYRLEFYAPNLYRQPTVHCQQHYAFAVRKGRDDFEIIEIARKAIRDENGEFYIEEPAKNLGLFSFKETIEKLRALEKQYAKDAQHIRSATQAPGGRLPLSLVDHVSDHMGTNTSILRAKLLMA